MRNLTGPTLSSGIVLALLWPALASSQPPTRDFTAAIAPATVAAGQEADFELTITNAGSSSHNIQSATVAVPLEFVVVGTPAPDTTGGSAQGQGDLPSWSTGLSSNLFAIIKDASTRLQPGDSMVLAFTAEAACPIDAGTYTFVTAAFQSDDAESTPFALQGNQPTVTVTGTCAQCETWAGETAWSAGTGYNTATGGNWAMFSAYEADTAVDLLAGQHHLAGRVHFSDIDGEGNVKITVTLNEGYRFKDTAENVKIQDYDSEPSGNPAPGQFADRGNADPTSNTYEAVVPWNDYYGVHVDLERCDD